MQGPTLLLVICTYSSPPLIYEKRFLESHVGTNLIKTHAKVSPEVSNDVPLNTDVPQPRTTKLGSTLCLSAWYRPRQSLGQTLSLLWHCVGVGDKTVTIRINVSKSPEFIFIQLTRRLSCTTLVWWLLNEDKNPIILFTSNILKMIGSLMCWFLLGRASASNAKCNSFILFYYNVKKNFLKIYWRNYIVQLIFPKSLYLLQYHDLLIE